MRKPAVVPVLLSVVITSGCVQNGSEPVTQGLLRPKPPTSVATSTAPTQLTSTVAPTSPPVTETTSEPTPSAPTCDKPSKALLDWAAMAIATGPGPITGSAVVYAATTATGKWYVIAVDRANVRANGTLAGGHSRTLGLTDAVGGRSKNSKLIPLGGEVKGKLAITWDRVSWKGETLAAGKQAAAQAIACLDAG